MTTLVDIINNESYWYIDDYVNQHGIKCINEINISQLINKEEGVKIIAALISSKFRDTKNLFMIRDLIVKAPEYKFCFVQSALMNGKNLGDHFIQLCVDHEIDVHELNLPWLEDHTFHKYLIDEKILDVGKFTKAIIRLRQELKAFDDIFCYWKEDHCLVVKSILDEVLAMENGEEYFKRCHEYIQELSQIKNDLATK